MGLDMPPAGNTAARGSARKNPRDLTGIRGQQLAAEAAADKAEAAAQVAEAREAQRSAELSTVVDYTDAPTTGTKPNAVAEDAVAATEVEVGETVTEVEETVIDVAPRTKRIRMLDDLADMTYGREVIADAKFDEQGNMTRYPVLGGLRTYNFKAGVTYDVPADVAGHLAALGYTYDN